jgi:chromosomal replication initiator protein
VTSPVIRAVCERFLLSPADVTGPARYRTLLDARAAAVYIMRTRDGLSLPRIGQRLGGRDHSTVLNAMRRAEKLMLRDPIVADFIAVQLALHRRPAPPIEPYKGRVMWWPVEQAGAVRHPYHQEKYRRVMGLAA